jgi:hypothetical protein
MTLCQAGIYAAHGLGSVKALAVPQPAGNEQIAWNQSMSKSSTAGG